jgi:hypothetical protein
MPSAQMLAKCLCSIKMVTLRPANRLCLLSQFHRCANALIINFHSMAQQPLVGQGLPIVEVSRSHSARHTTRGRIPLDEWSARRRDLYLTTQDTHDRRTFMLSAGFKPAIPASERPHTHMLDSAATGIGFPSNVLSYIPLWSLSHSVQRHVGSEKLG